MMDNLKGKNEDLSIKEKKRLEKMSHVKPKVNNSAIKR
jgi:hypothetical protein